MTISRQVPKNQLDEQLDEARRRTDSKMEDRALSLKISTSQGALGETQGKLIKQP
jgi:hypothetical protein